MRKLLLSLFTVSCLSHASFSQSGLNFNSVNPDYVDVGNGMNAVLAGTDKITVEAWCYLTDYTFLPTIVGNYGNGTMQFLLRVDNERPAFWINNAGFRVVNGGTRVPLNTWTHLAGVWDGNQLQVYINGVLDGSSTITGGGLVSTTHPVRIGASLTSEPFTGSIDEVRIWNVARTATQIASRMNSCYTGSVNNLLAYYNFEEGTGTTLTDRSGNGYNGTFVNSPTWTTGSTCLTTLPVSFSSIHAENKNNQTSINWKVSLEQDIMHYVVERSADGISFSPIGTVAATGATSYSFQDKETSGTGIYYRVKSVELSGISKFSSVVKIADVTTKSAISIFPNPATGGKVNLQLQNKAEGKYTVRVVDMMGKVQLSQVVQHLGSTSVSNMTLPAGLNAGLYVLQITDSNKQTESSKFYYQP